MSTNDLESDEQEKLKLQEKQKFQELISNLYEIISRNDKRYEEGVREYEERSREHEERLKKLQTQTAKAEANSREAEAREKEAIQKHQEAVEFQRGQYKDLIRELFEVPREKIEKEIQNTSRTSCILTTSAAIGSIIIALLTVGYSQRSADQLLNSIKSDFLGNQQQVQNMSSTLDAIRQQLAASSLVPKIVEFCKEFNNCTTTNDVALMYLHRLVGAGGHWKYREYLLGMEFAGISPEVVSDPLDLQSWERELINLLDRRILRIDLIVLKNEKEFVPEGNQLFSTFARSGEKVDHKNIGEWLQKKKKNLLQSIEYNETFASPPHMMLRPADRMCGGS